MSGIAGAITFSTASGDIGFWATGKIPIRNNIKDSLYIRDGSLPENDWHGFYPTDENPHVINPKSGYIVSCNNMINPDPNSFNGIGTTIPSTARALRANGLIKMYLKLVKDLNVEHMKSIQNDVADLYAYRVTEQLVAILNRNQGEKWYPSNDSKERAMLSKIMEMMPKWTGEMKADSEYALIYSLWYDELYSLMLHKQFPDKYERESITKSFFSDYFLGNMISDWALDKETDSEYCETAENKDFSNKCAYNVLASALKAYQRIVAKYGTNEANWKWGYENMVDYPHVPFSDVKILKILFHHAFPSLVVLVVGHDIMIGK